MRPVLSFEQLVRAMLLQLFIKFEQDTNLQKKANITKTVSVTLNGHMFDIYKVHLL